MTRDGFFLFRLLNWHFFNMQLEVLIKWGLSSTIISLNIAFSSLLEKTFLSFKSSIINILDLHYISYVIFCFLHFSSFGHSVLLCDYFLLIYFPVYEFSLHLCLICLVPKLQIHKFGFIILNSRIPIWFFYFFNSFLISAKILHLKHNKNNY